MVSTDNKYITQEAVKVIEGAAIRLETLREKIKGTAFTLLTEFTVLLAEFTADFGFLAPLHQQIRAVRENNEVSAYINIKKSTESVGSKFVSAPAEREARSSVADLIEAEKLLDGYTTAVEQGILSCKKIIEVQMLERQREAK